MTRDEMVARMSSRELSTWLALSRVYEEEAEHRRHVMESGDGQVIVTGRDEPDDDEDDELDA